MIIKDFNTLNKKSALPFYYLLILKVSEADSSLIFRCQWRIEPLLILLVKCLFFEL